METVTFFIQVFLFWLIYLIVQAVFIVGIKLSAAGSTEKLPDGSTRDSEMILYPLAKFLLKKELRKIYYTETALDILYKTILSKFNSFAGLQSNGAFLLYNNDRDKELWSTTLMFDDHANIFGDVKMELHDLGVSFYAMRDEYVYSKWLRKPIIDCVVCMGSFWGLFTFLIPGLFITHNLIVLPLYVINTFALACVNKIVYKLTLTV